MDTATADIYTDDNSHANNNPNTYHHADTYYHAHANRYSDSD